MELDDEVSLLNARVKKADGFEIQASNNGSAESLAALYQACWSKGRDRDGALDVFSFREVDRDEIKMRAKADVPKAVTVLEWGKAPRILTSEFISEGVIIREEYEHILEAVLISISKGDGEDFGYHAKGFVKGKFPPYNPFLALNLVEVKGAKPPAVAVTGTPGIGKSMFLYYVLTLRLLAGMTTVLSYDNTHCILFSAIGVYSLKNQEMERLAEYLPIHTWFLIDSNQQVVTPPQEFIKASRTTPRLILIAASPRTKRLTFAKDLDVPLLWMEPFTLTEFIMGRMLQYTARPTSELALEEFYELFGPVAREAYKFAKFGPENYERIVKREIGKATLKDTQDAAFQAIEGYFEVGISHKVLCAFPMDNDRTDFYVKIPTQKLADLVVNALMLRSEREAMRVCSLFLLSDKTRSVAGRLLESLALAKLPKGGQWNMVPMAKQARDRTNQHWKIDHTAAVHVLCIGLRDVFLRIFQGNVDELSPTVGSFHSVPHYKFPKGSKPELKTGFHQPILPNFPTLDAYAYTESSQHLVIFQMTCSPKHELKSAGLDWLGPKKKVDVIVVTSYDGGDDVFTVLDKSSRIRNVYRLVLMPDPNFG